MVAFRNGDSLVSLLFFSCIDVKLLSVDVVFTSCPHCGGMALDIFPLGRQENERKKERKREREEERKRGRKEEETERQRERQRKKKKSKEKRYVFCSIIIV